MADRFTPYARACDQARPPTGAGILDRQQHGPSSDHFDGRHYRNLDPVGAHGLGGVLRWQLSRRRTRAAWPRWIVDPPQPPPGALPDGAVSLTFIGHSTFLIRLHDADGTVVTVLTDPIFSERCSPFRSLGPRRVRAPGLALDRLPPVDVVLVSHNHYDHMDLPSLRALAQRFAPRFVTLAGNARILARGGVSGAVELDWWDATTACGIVVTATPARHFSARGPLDRNRALWGGFMLAGGDGPVFFAGDSGTGRHWTMIRDRLGPPRLALLPIGAYEPRWFMQPVHMNPQEAVAARAQLGAATAIGTHHGTFRLTDEAIDQPVRDLAAARDAAGLRADEFDAMAFGETRLFGPA